MVYACKMDRHDAKLVTAAGVARLTHECVILTAPAVYIDWQPPRYLIRPAPCRYIIFALVAVLFYLDSLSALCPSAALRSRSSLLPRNEIRQRNQFAHRDERALLFSSGRKKKEVQGLTRARSHSHQAERKEKIEGSLARDDNSRQLESSQ